LANKIGRFLLADFIAHQLEAVHIPVRACKAVTGSADLAISAADASSKPRSISSQHVGATLQPSLAIIGRLCKVLPQRL